jgi:acyl-CoA reductase-like NAD-dependent aldehyde dehydrogenase
MKVYDKLYIDGAWVVPAGSGVIEVHDASTEEVMGSVPEGNAEDVDRAARAARSAFEAWEPTDLEERLKFVQRLAEGLQLRMADIGQVVAQEVGMPINLATMIQAGLPAAVMSSYVDIGKEFTFEERVGDSLVVREPVGVVGAITPWNYPLHQIVCKVAPALVAGCTVVLKPSEVAPLSAFILAEIVHDVGLPAGVFNLVSGHGQTVGEAISSHPEIDMVSFTGSTRAGKRVSEVAAATVKRVHLEMGGKSASILLDDADLSTAIPQAIGSCYLNSGQTCIAWTRMLVPKDKVDEAAAIAKQIAEGYKVGNALETDTTLGPLVSHAQRDRVRDYIRKGIEEGATLVTGGPEEPDHVVAGYFVKPTVFANVTNDMTIAQEEIFGPVLSIIGYEDEDDAVRIANDTVYGLHGSVFSADQERALRVARRLRTGQVDVNGQKFNPLAPFGGYKQSGRGRELGKYGLEEFLETKAIQV